MPRNKKFGTDVFRSKFLTSAGISLIGGVFWLSACNTPPENAADNSANSLAANSIAPKPTPDKTDKSESVVNYVLFVPNEDAMLTKRIVRDTSGAVATTYEQKSKRALELLFKRLEALPKGLPKGTRLLTTPKKDKNGVVQLNLSKQFLKLDTEPDTAVLLILDAIARTLGAVESKNGGAVKSAKALIEVEGKTVREFNQFSLAEPWEASGDVEVIPEDNAANKAGNTATDNKAADNKTADNAATGNKTSEEKPEVGY